MPSPAVEVAVEVGDDVELAAARAHLLQVALQLLEQRVVRGDRHHRHLAVDERERTVLQLAGGVRLGMDVRNFLELQRSLERDRVVHAAPEEQRVLLARERLGPGDDRGLERERRLQRRGQVAQAPHPERFLLDGQPAAQLGKRRREQEQRDQLRRERLGRGDADLRARAGEVDELGLAHHRRRADVADRQRVAVSELLRVLERGERVGGLARLRDHDHQGVRIGNALAVAILARDLDLAGHAREALDPVLGHRAGVIAGAAGEHQHAVDRGQHLLRAVAEEPRIDRADPLERVRDRARLLEDLLLHEVAIGAELGGRATRLDHRHGPLDALPAGVVDRECLAADIGHVAFLEVDHAARHRQQRRGVGSEEVVVFAQAHDQGTARAGADDPAGLARRDHRDRVRPLELGNRSLHRAQQVASARRVPVCVDEVRNDLGVGLRDEHVAFGRQAIAQRLEVLDDAVVDHRDLAARRVRVRIVGRRRAVRRPARVRDAGRACQRQPVGLRGEIGDPRRADQTVELRRRVADHAQPRRVVAAVLEAADAFDQDRDDVARGSRADDAAHGRFSPCSWVA